MAHQTGMTISSYSKVEEVVVTFGVLLGHRDM